jgi:hypothetical protein
LNEEVDINVDSESAEEGRKDALEYEWIKLDNDGAIASWSSAAAEVVNFGERR